MEPTAGERAGADGLVAGEVREDVRERGVREGAQTVVAAAVVTRRRHLELIDPLLGS